jgi:hypothetical protein
MATVTQTGKLAASARSKPRLASSRFNWTAALLSTAIIGGLYLDGWAHHHGKVDELLFTPWHAVLYGAVFIQFGFLFFNFARYLVAGRSWQRALPAGYLLSLAGSILFAFGGVFDLVWHQLFGLEVNLEALLSPSHLFLATCGFLIITGPLRAVWPRLLSGETRRWSNLGPLVLSLASVLALLGFFTEFAHPFYETFGSRYSGQALGVSAILIQTALMMGVILLPLRHGPLPFGSFTAVIFLGSAPVAVLRDRYELLPVALLAGIAADLLATTLQPSAARRPRLYLFAGAVPALFYAFYYLAIDITTGLAWRIHLWLGSIVLAAIVGLFLSFLVAPPMDGSAEEAA